MKFIPLMVPDIREEDIEAVARVLRSGMLVQGEQVAALEKRFAEYTGASHAIAVANGTASLHLALVALGVGPGDEVIVPAFSYVATANVVELVGASCVFVDIDRATFNIDVSKIEEAVTPRTKAIIPVHEFGLSCDLEMVVEIARKHNLAVVEDAACALGAFHQGRHVGTFGEIGSFSLHPRKAITSGEGGVITTNDPELARKLRILRNHGIEMQNQKMEFVEAGFNYRLTEMQAALVLSQFGRFEEILEEKQILAKAYFDGLQGLKQIELPVIPAGKTHSWQTFHVVVADSSDRDAVISELRENGVGSNYGAQCIPAQQYYQGKYSLASESLFPNASRAYRQGLALPLYAGLSGEDVARIVRTVHVLAELKQQVPD
jgi:dTDP-4-amino-4,6-dideoxygalactose transaminase